VAKTFLPASSALIAEVRGAATCDMATPVRAFDNGLTSRTGLPVFIVRECFQLFLQSCACAILSRMSPIPAPETRRDTTNKASHVGLVSI
jgi:hypothetical protein